MLRSALVALVFTAFTVLPSQAASITFDLTCVVGHPTPGQVQCGVPSYGSVTLSDSPGNGDILLTVNLADTGEKFKDLFFNYNGTATGITAGSGTSNLLDPNDVSHAPYSGHFDVGALGGDDPFTITLYGWGSTANNLGNSTTGGANNVNLTLANFQVLDTLNQTYLAVHIQNIGPNGCEAGGTLCTPGTTGNGSMNAVGANAFSTNGTDVNPQAVVPEPASILLLGTALIGSARQIRRRIRKS